MKNSLSKEIYLTPREEEVLTRIANGKDNLTIAKEMNLSRHTIKIHIRNIFQKLEVNDRTEAVVKAMHQGLLI